MVYKPPSMPTRHDERSPEEEEEEEEEEEDISSFYANSALFSGGYAAVAAKARADRAVASIPSEEVETFEMTLVRSPKSSQERSVPKRESKSKSSAPQEDTYYQFQDHEL